MKRTVLVIDDNPQIVNLAKITLGKAGYNVRTATSLRGARDSLQFGIPDVVVTDGIGLEWTRANLSEHAVPVVCTFGSMAPDVRVGEFLLEKPYDPSDLAMMVESCLKLYGGYKNRGTT